MPTLLRLLPAVLLLAATFTAPLTARAQVGIGITVPNASAALDIVSTSKGVLLPRVAGTGSVSSPATGLIVYQTTSPAGYYYYDGTGWQQLAVAGSTGFIRNQTTQQAGSNFNVSGSGTVGALTVAGAILGSGGSIGGAGLGVRADGGLNLGQNTTGNNVYLGYQAGQSTTGYYNLYVGYRSGAANTTGYYNTFGGYQSGANNVNGAQNAFSGANSGQANTSGSDNTFTGYNSGGSNTTGTQNTFSGSGSGYANTTGSQNTFDGYNAGVTNTTGNYNQFAGYGSGNANTTGTQNTFNGAGSGYGNTTGSQNTFSGYNAGVANTTGSYNQFGGYGSGAANTTGNYNTFGGASSGYSNTTGTNNTFSGNNSGYYTTTGSNNTLLGEQAGAFNTTGVGNTFVGSSSGYDASTGSNNTALGVGSGPASGSGTVANTLALGNGAKVTASNAIQLGNASIASLRCQVGLTVTSDARFKYDVQANVPGLAFITALRPVTYRFDDERLAAFERSGALAPRSAPDPAAVVHTGFLAQEVEATARSLGFRFDGVHAPASARDHYGLGYAQFVVPLVRAVQELSAENTTLRGTVQALQRQADADHASLLTLQAQLARLLGEGAQAQK